jgi:hypothetical protein
MSSAPPDSDWRCAADPKDLPEDDSDASDKEAEEGLGEDCVKGTLVDTKAGARITELAHRLAYGLASEEEGDPASQLTGVASTRSLGFLACFRKQTKIRVV